MMYSRGPRTEPCGRPYGAGTHRDLVEPWTTLKVRSWRKEPIHPRKLPDSPNVTFNRRILWSTAGLQCQKRRFRRTKLTMSAQLCQWPRRCQIVAGAAEFQLSELPEARLARWKNIVPV